MANFQSHIAHIQLCLFQQGRFIRPSVQYWILFGHRKCVICCIAGVVSAVIITIILATAIAPSTRPTNTSQIRTIIVNIGSIGITHKAAAGDATQVSRLSVARASEGTADLGTGVGGEGGVYDAKQVGAVGHTQDRNVVDQLHREGHEKKRKEVNQYEKDKK